MVLLKERTSLHEKGKGFVSSDGNLIFWNSGHATSVMLASVMGLAFNIGFEDGSDL
jgi:hypothetical protein